MPIPKTELGKRLMRWQLSHTAPAPLSIDHPVQIDLAAAADEIERLASLTSAREVTEPMIAALLDLELEDGRLKNDHRHLIAKWTPRLQAALASAPQPGNESVGQPRDLEEQALAWVGRAYRAPADPAGADEKRFTRFNMAVAYAEGHRVGIEAPVPSRAPQPACVGVGEERVASMQRALEAFRERCAAQDKFLALAADLLNQSLQEVEKDSKHQEGDVMTDDLFELRNTKLPRHHRDAEDAMHWAADEIERLRLALSPAPSPQAGGEKMPSPDTLVKNEAGYECAAMFYYAMPEGIDAGVVARENGFEARFYLARDILDDDDPVNIAYEAGDANVALNWRPEASEGFTWAGSWDSEDGPIACFVRALSARREG